MINNLFNKDVIQYKAEMHISDDYETNNRTVLEIIQGVINQVPSINIKSHIL